MSRSGRVLSNPAPAASAPASTATFAPPPPASVAARSSARNGGSSPAVPVSPPGTSTPPPHPSPRCTPGSTPPGSRPNGPRHAPAAPHGRPSAHPRRRPRRSRRTGGRAAPEPLSSFPHSFPTRDSAIAMSPPRPSRACSSLQVIPETGHRNAPLPEARESRHNPGMMSDPRITPFRTALAQHHTPPPPPDPSLSEAAVLLTLRLADPWSSCSSSGPRRRATRGPVTWPCPAAAATPTTPGSWQTALRETHEETGIVVPGRSRPGRPGPAPPLASGDASPSSSPPSSPWSRPTPGPPRTRRGGDRPLGPPPHLASDAPSTRSSSSWTRAPPLPRPQLPGLRDLGPHPPHHHRLHGRGPGGRSGIDDGAPCTPGGEEHRRPASGASVSRNI
jgi:hypothetical protein